MNTLNLDGQWSVLPQDFACSGESGLIIVQQAQEGWLPAQVHG